MIRFRRAIAAFALALFPLTATAEPIGWSYTVTTGTPTGAPYLYIGTVSHADWGGPGVGDITNTYRAYNPVSSGTQSGTHTGDMRYVSPGGSLSAALHVGDVGYPTLDLVSDSMGIPPRPSDPTWRVSMAITDAASGQAGTASFDWTPFVFPDVFTSGTGVVDWKQESQTKTLVLGDHRYTVTTFQQDHESHAELLAEVTVTQNTPEPGTLALAGIGLAGVGLRRVRRFAR